MKISYAIPVCNEYKEIEYLLEYLTKHKREQDEIVVQCDQGNTTQEVYNVLKQYPDIKVIEFALNKDFALFKNNLNTYFCFYLYTFYTNMISNYDMR